MPDLLSMAILLVLHKITDLEAFLGTYAEYEEAREQDGVTEAHILQPDDDPQTIVVIAFFDTAEAAENHRTFLREQVWTSTSAVPGMGGEPRAMVLHEVDTGSKT
jgi:heme-degrading monooxygenase HmoA